MIYGIGTDLCSVARMDKSLNSPAFMRRVFGEEENLLLASLSEHHKRETAAANFAAKEAFLKAAGKGIGDISLCSIQALRQESGMPYYHLTGTALAWAKEQHISAKLSLTHECGMALAFCVLENTPESTG